MFLKELDLVPVLLKFKLLGMFKKNPETVIHLRYCRS